MSDIVIAEPAGLAPTIQQLVDRTLAADRAGGEALWLKACAVADAKNATKRGEWESYLAACGLHEREARRLSGIAHRGRQSPEFRDKVISGWLRFSVAAIVAQADEPTMHRLISQDEPPTVKQLAPAAPPAPAPQLPMFDPPAPKTDNVVRCLDCHATDVVEVAEAARYLCRACCENRNLKVVRILTVRGWIDLGVSHASADLAVSPVAIAAGFDRSQFVISHLKTGMALAGKSYPAHEAIRLFNELKDLDWTDMRGTHALGDGLNAQVKQILGIPDAPDDDRRRSLVDRAAAVGYQLSKVGDGYRFMQRETGAPMGGAKSLDAAESIIERWEQEAATDAPKAAPKGNGLVCARCGWTNPTILYTKVCQSCYSLSEAQKWESGSDDMRWRLKAALEATRGMPEDLQRARAAEIRGVAEAHNIDIDAPIIAAPMAVEPDQLPDDQPPDDAPAPPRMASAETQRMQQAESLIASVIDLIPERAIRLIAALAVPDYEPNGTTDPREELWILWKTEARDNPGLVEAAMSEN
jgi:hypothetical protein